MILTSALILLTAPAFFVKTESRVDLTFICSNMVGNAAYIGSTKPAGEIVEDGFTNGVAIITISANQNKAGANVVFKDAMERTNDLSKTGIVVGPVSIGKGTYMVTANFAEGVENYVLSTDEKGNVGILMSHQKIIAGHIKFGIYKGSYSVG